MLQLRTMMACSTRLALFCTFALFWLLCGAAETASAENLSGDSLDLAELPKLAQFGCRPGDLRCRSGGCCRAGTTCCFGQCCTPGSVCTPQGCKAVGMRCEGNRFCSPGLKCSIGGGCVPQNNVDCGRGRSCFPGRKCTANGCVPIDAVD